MSYPKVKEYLESIGFGDKITVHADTCDTVEHAAQMIGCEPKQIAKTMSFLVEEQPIVIVCAGDAKVDNAKYKAFFGKKAKMVPWGEVESVIGHEPGGVCAFGLNEGVKPYLDVSLKRFDKVYSAAGAENCTCCLTVPELETATGFAEWIDVCKDWN